MKLYYLVPFICLIALQPAFAVVDNNGNGMSDVWERLYDAVDADPTADEDDDDQSNLQESIAGTDPHDKDSVLNISNLNHRSSGLFVGWASQIGIRYQVESSKSLNSNEWAVEGEGITGNGGMIFKGFDRQTELRKFYRLNIIDNQSDLVNQALESLTYDSDGDGLSDVKEINAGLNPFDATSRGAELSVKFGGSVDLTWQAQQGKRYQIQRRSTVPLGVWEDEGMPHLGMGGDVTATVLLSGTIQSEFKVNVSDVDTDEDGITDWEEDQVGLDPRMTKTDPLGAGDLSVLNAQMITLSEVSVKAAGAVANITRLEDGGFELYRTGGADALTIQYTISGTAVADSDYVALSGTAIIPFGKNSVVIPVTPMAGSSMLLSESVILTLIDGITYDLDSHFSQQVNVIKEVLLDVTGYGAIGDGVTDDTLAIQSAIIALEQSASHNTLYFPNGKYRLNSTVLDDHYGRPKLRILTMGATDMAGRDIIFYGEGDAILYSTTSPVRADILVARASFRSLQFYDMKWEKDSVPLSPITSAEPNDADGVSLVYYDNRDVEQVGFVRCNFLNCHGAVRTYLGGAYENRGKLNNLGLYDCVVINPYGANTVDSQYSWGGGQQVKISSWVGRMVHLRNYFDGGSEDMTDASTSPGGHIKDGSHFGSPLDLIFKNNTVLRMGAEAVLQDSINNFLGNNTSSFAIPPADSVTEAVFTVSGSSQFINGNVINIRTIGTPLVQSSNTIFLITDYNTSTRVLKVVNTGYETNAAEGTVIPSGRSIFLQDYDPTTALIEGNVVDGTVPPGGVGFDAVSGIVCIGRGNIHGNYINGFWSGINLYDDTKRPLYYSSRGTRISSNVIVTRNSQDYSKTYENGMILRGGYEHVYDNYISTPISYQFGGIIARDKDSLLERNYVAAMESINNGYWSPKRSVGIAAARTSINVVMKGNYTYGLDIGAGPQAWNQDPPHYVIDHHSFNDQLGVDPVGLLPNE